MLINKNKNKNLYFCYLIIQNKIIILILKIDYKKL